MRPSVFDFNDYRKYLEAFYFYEKKASGLSFSSFAKNAKINSANYLKLIIQGHRNLTQKNIFLFAKAARLSENELVFFETLVHLNQSERPEEKTFYKKRLLHAKSAGSWKKSLGLNAVTKSWSLPACAVAAHGKTTEEAIQFLVNRCRFSRAEATTALETLKEQKILVCQGDGKLSLEGSFFTASDPRSLNDQQRHFLEEQLKVSLREFKPQYRAGTGQYISHPMTSPSDGAHFLKSDFLDSLARRSRAFDEMPSDGSEKLLQVNIQIFEVRSARSAGSTGRPAKDLVQTELLPTPQRDHS